MRTVVLTLFILCVSACNSPSRHGDRGGAAPSSGVSIAEDGESSPQKFFTVDNQGKFVFSPGYAAEVPPSDYIVMSSMARGIGGPHVILDLMNEQVQYFSPWKDSGHIASLPLSKDAIAEYRQTWTADRLAAIPPSNDKIVLGGRKFFVYANIGGSIFNIYHEDTENQDLIELRDIYATFLLLTHEHQ